MKILYIGLLSLFAQIALFGQVPCNEILDSFNFIPKLDPDTEFVPFTEGFTYDEVVVLPPDEGAEYKKVITWVHGMNGNSSSWVHASDYADRHYNALPLRIDYNDFQSSLATVRAGVKGDFQTKWEALKDLTDDEGKRKSFAFAHSLGGIAIRGASESYPYLEGKVNGIVTINSPHGGSKLANYVDTPFGPGDPALVEDLKEFAAESCWAFGLGPIREKEQTNELINILTNIGFLDIEKVLSGVCETVTDEGIPLVIDNIAPLAVSELVPNGNALNINERVSDSHKMAFATSIVDIPDAHHHAFKMFYSGRNSPSDRGMWEADELTEEALKKHYENLDKYISKYLEYKKYYDDKPSWKPAWMCYKQVVPSVGIPWVGDCITYNDCKDISNGYGIGVNQFRLVNDYWEYTVGAREYIEYEPEDCSVLPFFLQPACHWNNIQNGLYPIYSELKDYDGFLTTESLSDWESCPVSRRYSFTPSNNFKGSDHLQIKNDSNTKFIVDFTLLGGGADFFGDE